MQIAYDEKSGNITCNKYSIGTSYGDEWSRKPIYLIRCQCGCPLVAYFTERPPYADMGEYGMSDSGYGGNYKAVHYNSKSAQAWGFTIRDDQHCPDCRRDLFTGASAFAAVEAFVKKTLHIHKGNLNETKILDLVSRLKSDTRINSRFSFQHDIFSSREDCILTINNDGYNEYRELLKALELDYEDEPKWIDDQPDHIDHTDLETDIIAAHGEDCTCSLCME